MVYTTTKAQMLMETALNARVQRQDMIASNIANIDTPNYKARDIDFESALIEKTKQMYGKNDVQELQLTKTNDKHMSSSSTVENFRPTVYTRDTNVVRNDGNTVDLDIETTELSKNAVMFNALTAALKKNSQIFKSVLEASARV